MMLNNCWLSQSMMIRNLELLRPAAAPVVTVTRHLPKPKATVVMMGIAKQKEPFFWKRGVIRMVMDIPIITLKLKRRSLVVLVTIAVVLGRPKGRTARRTKARKLRLHPAAAVAAVVAAVP